MKYSLLLVYLRIIIIFVYHIFPCNYLITQRLPWQAENCLVRHYIRKLSEKPGH